MYVSESQWEYVYTHEYVLSSYLWACILTILFAINNVVCLIKLRNFLSKNGQMKCIREITYVIEILIFIINHVDFTVIS